MVGTWVSTTRTDDRGGQREAGRASCVRARASLAIATVRDVGQHREQIPTPTPHRTWGGEGGHRAGETDRGDPPPPHEHRRAEPVEALPLLASGVEHDVEHEPGALANANTNPNGSPPNLNR